MSAISSVSSVSTNLSALGAHAGGHKKGVHGASKTDSSDGAADSDPSSGSTQGLFSSLLDSAEKIIGAGASVLASQVPGGTAALGAITGAGSAAGANATNGAGATSSAAAAASKALGSTVNTHA